MKKPEYEEAGVFFLTFIGEYVEIITDLKSIEPVETEEGIVPVEVGITLKGYLLDEDDKYYFLGGQPTEVSDAIKKACVKHIRIVPLKTVQDEILDSMPDPVDDKEIN